MTRFGVLLFGLAVLMTVGTAYAQAPLAPTQIPPAPAQIPRQTPAAPSTPSTGIGQGTWLWQRTEYSDDTTVTAPDPGKYTVSFQADGRLVLQIDCNRGTGTYTVDGPQLTISPGAITLIACGPGSQDRAFTQNLRDVATYVFDGENLVLNLRADSGNMVFGPQPPASLTGSAWRVQSYNNGRGGVVSVLPDVELTATFDPMGNVSGNAGCNGYRGPYTVSGNRIAFGSIVSTKRACLSEALNQQEQRFLDALGASTSFELVGDRLTLRDNAGATQLVLVRPSIQPVPGAP